MSKTIAVTVLVMFQVFGLTAWACRGPFAERYLIWYDTPELQPTEIALEIDSQDFSDNYGHRNYRLPTYKVKRVLAGEFDKDTVVVERAGGTCHHEIAPGVSTQLVLVGVLRDLDTGGQQLIPRYMTYDDPIRIEAERLLNETSAMP